LRYHLLVYRSTRDYKDDFEDLSGFKLMEPHCIALTDRRSGLPIGFSRWNQHSQVEDNISFEVGRKLLS
jgi:hypothetical protein